jgi:hypothetical protein
VNERLSLIEAFNNCSDDDPLELWRVLRIEIMTRSEGHTAFDKDAALRAWHTLSMHSGESLLLYGKRAIAAFERLSHAGVNDLQLPTEAEKVMKFVSGLNMQVPQYEEYSNYLRNSVKVFDVSAFPLTLTNAIKAVSLYRPLISGKRSGTSSTGTAPAITTTQTSLGAIADKTMKKGHQKTKPEERTDQQKKDTASFLGECWNCGKSGHHSRDCPDKKKAPAGAWKGGKSVKFSNIITCPEPETEVSFWSANVQVIPTIPTLDILRTEVKSDALRFGPYDAIFDTGATGTIQPF